MWNSNTAVVRKYSLLIDLKATTSEPIDLAGIKSGMKLRLSYNNSC